MPTLRSLFRTEVLLFVLLTPRDLSEAVREMMMTNGLKSVVTRVMRNPGAAGKALENRTIGRFPGSSAGCPRRRLSSGGGIATEWQGERQPGAGGDELQRGLNPEEVGGLEHELQGVQRAVKGKRVYYVGITTNIAETRISAVSLTRQRFEGLEERCCGFTSVAITLLCERMPVFSFSGQK